jgi:hypothetical protein
MIPLGDQATLSTPACWVYYLPDKIFLVEIFQRFKSFLHLLISRKYLDCELVCQQHLTFPTAGRVYSWQVEDIIFRTLTGSGLHLEPVIFT